MGAFNGSGTFVRSYNWTTDAGNGIKIRADRMDTEDDGFAAGLSDCVTRDGQSPPTANLPMATFRHTGVGNAVARTDYAAAGQIQDGGLVFAVAAGTGAYTATLAPAVLALVDGSEYRIRFTSANTVAASLALNGLSAVNLCDRNGAQILASIIPAGAEMTFRYESSGPKLVQVSGSISPMLLEKGTATTTTLIAPTTLLSSLFTDYVLRIKHFVTQGGSPGNPQLLFSTNGGGSVLVSGYDTITEKAISGTATVAVAANTGGASGISLLSQTPAAGDLNCQMVIHIFNPSDTTSGSWKWARADVFWNNSATENDTISGNNSTASAVNAIWVQAPTGTFSCTWELWGQP